MSNADRWGEKSTCKNEMNANVIWYFHLPRLERSSVESNFSSSSATSNIRCTPIDKRIFSNSNLWSWGFDMKFRNLQGWCGNCKRKMFGWEKQFRGCDGCEQSSQHRKLRFSFFFSSLFIKFSITLTVTEEHYSGTQITSRKIKTFLPSPLPLVDIVSVGVTKELAKE